MDTSSDTFSYQVGTLNTIMDFFGLELPAEVLEVDTKNITNKGSKNDVWPETVAMLDEFYEPYNKRLANLLHDGKWLYKRHKEL